MYLQCFSTKSHIHTSFTSDVSNQKLSYSERFKWLMTFFSAQIKTTFFPSVVASLQDEKLRQKSLRWQILKVILRSIQWHFDRGEMLKKAIFVQKRVGGVGVSTTNSMATRQQPPPQYSTTPMEQEYPGQQGQQYQAGYPVDPRLHEQGQYRSQYQGRGQPRSQYQQQGVWDKFGFTKKTKKGFVIYGSFYCRYHRCS